MISDYCTDQKKYTVATNKWSDQRTNIKQKWWSTPPKSKNNKELRVLCQYVI